MLKVRLKQKKGINIIKKKKLGNEQGKVLLLTQIRQRRELVRKSETENYNEFDNVLDDEIDQKIDKVVNILSKADLITKHLVGQLRKLITDDSDLVIVLRALIKRNNLHEKIEKNYRCIKLCRTNYQ